MKVARIGENYFIEQDCAKFSKVHEISERKGTREYEFCDSVEEAELMFCNNVAERITDCSDVTMYEANDETGEICMPNSNLDFSYEFMLELKGEMDFAVFFWQKLINETVTVWSWDCYSKAVKVNTIFENGDNAVTYMDSNVALSQEVLIDMIRHSYRVEANDLN